MGNKQEINVNIRLELVMKLQKYGFASQGAASDVRRKTTILLHSIAGKQGS